MANQSVDENAITIYKGGVPRNNIFELVTKSNFFKERILIKKYHDKIEFKHIDISYRGKTNKFTFSKKRNYYHTKLSIELPLGKFKFDEEESNEDIIVIYFD